MKVEIAEYEGSAQEDDVIASLLARVYVQAGFTDAALAGQMFASIEVKRRGKLILARDSDAHLIGMVICASPNNPYRQVANSDEAEMQLLAVAPEARGHGIGRKLCQAFESSAGSMGFNKAVLYPHRRPCRRRTNSTNHSAMRAAPRATGNVPGGIFWSMKNHFAHKGATVLELRPSCENCNKPLPPASLDARICSYECTFCADCVEKVLGNVCPNCGGGFVPRPIRPSRNWKGDNYLGKDPASTTVKHRPVDAEEHARFSAVIKAIPPERR